MTPINTWIPILMASIQTLDADDSDPRILESFDDYVLAYPDEDYDDDGVLNKDDDFARNSSFTTDTDGDGFPDRRDPDKDGDGVPNEEDTLELNPDVWNQAQYDIWYEQQDNDGDGMENYRDPFPDDEFNGQGPPKGHPEYEAWYAEQDFDNDGVLNPDDPAPYLEDVKTDYEYERWHLDAERAKEGIWDGTLGYQATYDQIFVTPEQYDPEDPLTYDTDKDGIRDAFEIYTYHNLTTGIEANGIADWGVMERDSVEGASQEEYITYDPTMTWLEYAQALGDWKTPNNDIDGDGVSNLEDAFVYSKDEWEDVDEDGLGDNLADDDVGEVSDALLDSDGDGYVNKYDDFPYNPNEWLDSDGDGIGDEGDYFPNDPEKSLMPDMDGDGVEDSADLFPTDPTKTGYTEAEVAAREAEVAAKLEAAGYVNYHAMANDDTNAEAEEKGRIRFEEKLQEYADRFYTHTPGSYNHQDTDYLEELLDLDAIAEFSKYHEYYSVISNPDHPGGYSGAKAIVYQGYPRPLTVQELWQGYQAIMRGETPRDPRHREDMTSRMAGASSNIPVGYIFHDVVMDRDYTSDTTTYEEDGRTVMEGPVNYVVKEGDGVYNWGTGDTWTARDRNTGLPLESTQATLNMAMYGAIPVIKNGYWNEDLAKIRVGLYDSGLYGLNDYHAQYNENGFTGFLSTEDVYRIYGDDADEHLQRRYVPEELKIRNDRANEAQVMQARRLLAEQYVQDMSQGHLWKRGSVVTGQAIPFKIQSGENPDGTPIYLDEGFDTKYNIVDEFENPDTYQGKITLPLRGLDPTAGLIRGADVIPTEREIVEAYYLIASPYLGKYNKASADAWLASQDDVVIEIFNNRSRYLEPSDAIIDSFMDYVGIPEILKVGGVQHIPLESWEKWVGTLEGDDKKSGEELKNIVSGYQAGEYLDFPSIGFITLFNKQAVPTYEDTDIEEDTGRDTLLSELAKVNAVIGYQDAWRNSKEQPEYQQNFHQNKIEDMDSFHKQLYYSSSYANAANVSGYDIARLYPTYYELNFNAATDSYTKTAIYPQFTASFNEGGWYQDAATQMVNRFKPPLYIEVTDQAQKDSLWSPEDVQSWKNGEEGHVWRDNTRLYMKLPDHRVDVEAPYKEYQRVIAAGGTEEEAKKAAEAAQSPNDFYTTQDQRTGSFTEGIDPSLYSTGGWDTEDGAYPSYEYSQNAQYGGIWIDTSNGTAPVGSYTMMYIAQPKPIKPKKEKWYEEVFDAILPIALVVTAIFFPKAYLVLQGLRAISGETLKTNDYIGIVTAGLKVGGKLKMPSTEAEATKRALEAQDAAVAAAVADGLTQGTLLASIGQAAYDSAYLTEITGAGIFGLTARQSVALINAAGTGNIGTAVVSAFGPDYISKGFENLGLSSSIYTNMDPAVKLGLSRTMEHMLNGDSFNEALQKGGVEALAEYISETGYSDEIQKIIKDFMGDVAPAVNGVKDLFNVDAIGDAIEQITGVVSEDLLKDMAVIFEEAGDIGEAVIGIAEQGLDIVEDNVIAPVVDLVGGAASSIYQSLKTEGEIFPDGIPEGLTEQVDALIGGLEEGLKDTFTNLDDATKKALEVSVAQLILTGEMDELGVEKAFAKELITADTVAGLVEVDALSAIGPEVLTQAVRTAMTTGMAGGNASNAFMQTLATAAANSLKYAVQVGGIDGLTREIGQFWDNVSGQKREVEENVENLEKLKAEAEEQVKKIETATNTLKERQERLSTLYSAAIAQDATDADREAFLAYSNQYLDTIPTLEQNINGLKGDLATIDSRYNTEYNDYLANVAKIEEYSRDSSPELQVEYDNLNVYMAAQLNPEFNWEEYAEVNNLGDVGVVEAAKHYIQEGYVEGVPTSQADYDDRLQATSSAYVDKVLESQGIDMSYLPSDVRLDVRAAIIDDALAAASDASQTPLEFFEMMQDNALIADAYITGSDVDNAVLNAYSQNYPSLSNPGAGLDSVFDISAHNMEERANNVMQAITPIDLNTGAPEDPEAYEQYLSDVIEGQLFVSLNESGDYVWDEATQTIKYNPLTGLQEVVDITPGKTLSQMAAEDPIVYLTTLGSIEDNALAMDYVKKVQEEFGVLPETPPYQEVIDGDPSYTDLPWIARVARDVVKYHAERRQYYLDKVEELEAFEGPLTPEQEYELAEAAQLYGQADADLLSARGWVNTGVNMTGYWNTVIRVFGVAGQEAEARQAGVRAQHAAASQEGVSIEEAREIGAKVTEKLLSEIDYNVVTDNALSRQLNVIESMVNGYLPAAYTEDVTNMYKVLNSGETFMDGVLAAGEAAIKYPKAFYNEIIKNEIREEVAQFVLGGAAVGFTKVAAKGLGAEILERAVTSAALSQSASLAQEAVAEYSSVVDDIYDTAMSRLKQTDQYLNADDATRERLEFEYSEAAYAKSIEGGTVALTAFVATLPLEGSLDKLLSRSFFGDKGLDAISGMVDTDKTILNVADEFLDTVLFEGYAEAFQEGASSIYAESAYYDLGVPSENPEAQVGASAAVAFMAGTTTTAAIAPTAYAVQTPIDRLASEMDDPFAIAIVSGNKEVQEAVQEGDVSKVSALLSDMNLAEFAPLNIDMLNATDDSYILTPKEVVEAYAEMGLVAPPDFAASLSSAYQIDPDTGQISISSPVADNATLDEQLAVEWDLAFPTDSDNDGVVDREDAFPNDPSETTDSDNDGVGDNADAFPNDASETVDSDEDGVGDNADEYPTDARFFDQASFSDYAIDNFLDMDAQIKELQAKIDTQNNLLQQVSDLTAEKTQLEKDKNDLQDKYDTDIAAKDTEINALDVQIEALELDADADDTTIDTLAKAKEQLEQDKVDLQAQYDTDIAAKDTEISGLNTNIAQLNTTIAEQAGTIDAQTKTIGELEADKASLETDLATAEQGKVDLQAQYDTDIAAKDTEIGELNTSIADLNGQIETLSTAALADGETIAEREASIAQLETDKSTLETDLATAEQDKVDLQAQYDTDIAAKDTEISGLNTSIAQLNTTIAEQAGTIDAQTKTIGELEADKASLETDLATAEQGKVDLQAQYDTDIAAKDTEIGELNTSIADLNGQIETLSTAALADGETIAEREASIAQLETDKSTLETDLATAEQDKVDLQAQYDTDIAAKDTEISGLNTNIAQLNTTIAEQAGTIDAQTKTIGELEADKASLETDLATAEQGKVDLQAQYDTDIAAKDTEIGELNTSIADLNGQIETLSTAALADGETIAEREASIAQLETDKSTLETDLATAEQDKVDLQAQYDTDIAAKDTEISGLNTSIAQLNTTIAEQAGTIDTQTKTIGELEADKASLETELATAEQGKVDLQAQYDTDIAAKDTEIGELNTSIADLNGQIETLSTAALADGETIADRDASIAQLETDKSTLETNLATAEQDKVDLQAQYDTDIAAKDTEINGLNTNIAQLNTTIAEQAGTIDTQTKTIGELEADKASLETDLATAEQGKVDLQAQYDTDIAAKDTEIGELNTSIADLNGQIETLSTAALADGETIAEREASIAQLETDKSTLETDLATAEQDKVDLQAQYDTDIAAKDTEISGLNTSIAQLNTTIAEQAGTIDAQTKTIGELEADKASLETDLATAEQGKVDLQAQYDTDIAAKDTEIGELNTSIADLNGQIETLSTAALADGETIAEREASIAQLETDKSTLETDLATAEQDKVDLQAQYDTDIAAKDTEISGLNTSIAQLNTTIAEQAGTIADQRSELETTADILGKEANLVTEEDVQLVTDYLAGVELTQDKLDNILRYDVTGQDDLVTQDDLALLTQAYTLGDYTGFDPDADFNPATGTYKTIADKNAEIADLEQEALEAEIAYQEALEQNTIDVTEQVTTEIQTDITREIDDLAKKKKEQKEREFAQQILGPGRQVKVETPQDPAIIQYEFDMLGDSIFATPEQEMAYTQRTPYSPEDATDNPYGQSLMSRIQNRLQSQQQQSMSTGGKVKAKTSEILRILGER